MLLLTCHRTADIQALRRLTGTLIDLCFDYRITECNFSEFLDRITKRLVELRSRLEQLLMAVNSSASAPLLWSKVDGLLEQCKILLNALESEIRQNEAFKTLEGISEPSLELEGLLAAIDEATVHLKDSLDINDRCD